MTMQLFLETHEICAAFCLFGMKCLVVKTALEASWKMLTRIKSFSLVLFVFFNDKDISVLQPGCYKQKRGTASSTNVKAHEFKLGNEEGNYC